jgi:alanine racemase
MENKYSSWVSVNLDAIKSNLRMLIEQTNTPVMAIVKANAYGHGAVPVALAALQAGVTWLGVARPSEALELRQAGFSCPILLLGYTPESQISEMIANQVSLTVWDMGQVRQISALAAQSGQNARLHLKVDTGMSRLGVQVNQADTLAKKIIDEPNIDFEGIFTHFARADEADLATTDAQESRLLEFLATLEKHDIQPPWIHAANSAASLTRPSAYFNLLRFGIAMYGLHPSLACPMPSTFRPALTWKTVLSQVKSLSAGRGISYGHTYTTRKTERIGTIPVGYADGFRRIPGQKVLVAGKRVPDAKAGDEVVLIGQQQQAYISAEHMASSWGTINYEVVCAIGSRIPRLYE